MIEIIAINTVREGMFIVHYKNTSSCGCAYTRHSYVWGRTTEPTIAQALIQVKKVIADEAGN